MACHHEMNQITSVPGCCALQLKRGDQHEGYEGDGDSGLPEEGVTRSQAWCPGYGRAGCVPGAGPQGRLGGGGRQGAYVRPSPAMETLLHDCGSINLQARRREESGHHAGWLAGSTAVQHSCGALLRALAHDAALSHPNLNIL